MLLSFFVLRLGCEILFYQFPTIAFLFTLAGQTFSEKKIFKNSGQGTDGRPGLAIS